MRILYFINSISNYRSGVHATTIQKCAIMINNGHQVTLVGSYKENGFKFDPRISLIKFKHIGPQSLNFLIGYRSWLNYNIANFDIVSIETIWSISNYFLVAACVKHKIPFIVTPHGMLHPEALKISKIKKSFSMHTFLDLMFNKASAFHALNNYEHEIIRNLKFNNKIFVIGNGINFPNPCAIQLDSTIDDLPLALNNKNICLYLGRLHPIKGIERLIDAWTSIKIINNWHLVIAGDGEKEYENILRQKVKDSRCQNISFVGFVSGDKKSFLYKICKFCVLPSYSEAFPMAILESFTYKKPVLITTACKFEDAITLKAAMQVESSITGIKYGLIDFFNFTDSTINIMGQSGYDLVKSQYSWEIIYKKMYNFYTQTIDIYGK
jgi:glycosyltransferase involved in cell wall biosynthesis